jgi:hypothetical protein
MFDRETPDDFLRRTQKLRQDYEAFAQDRVVPLFLDGDQRERRPPKHFKDSSFLLIRSYDGDNGNRPPTQSLLWLSPDILVSPVSNLANYTRTLIAGETYRIVCNVHNRGDLAVPSAKVEFWLCDPSLGFHTSMAKNLTLGRVPSAWVDPGGSAQVQFLYTVPPTESGHKCLFARVFSFGPLDRPVDLTRLDPAIDRHTGQLNLDIVGQGQPYQFNWIHAPNADERIEFVVMSPAEILALRHPLLAEVQPYDDVPQRGWVDMTAVELVETDARGVEIGRENNRLYVTSRDPDSTDIQTIRELRMEVQRVLAAVAADETRMMDHRDLVTKFRAVNDEVRRSVFRMQVPDLGLREGQVVGVHIRSVASSLQGEDEVMGGITLLIVA